MNQAAVFLRCLPVVAVLFLGACAETELVAHTAKQVEPSDRPTGEYKVGQPYEIAGIWYYPKVDYSYSETGIASWYGPNFHGKRTANGEIFDQHAMTAAHRTLPMPSVVRVTNLENGRSIKVRINDRGPFKRGRIIDLSRRGAELLGFVSKGTAKVRVEIVESESRQLAAVAQGATDDRTPEAVPRVAVVTQELTPPVQPVSRTRRRRRAPRFRRQVAARQRPSPMYSSMSKSSVCRSDLRISSFKPGLLPRCTMPTAYAPACRRLAKPRSPRHLSINAASTGSASVRWQRSRKPIASWKCWPPTALRTLGWS